MYANCDAAYHGTVRRVLGVRVPEGRPARSGQPPGDESQRANYYRHIGSSMRSTTPAASRLCSRPGSAGVGRVPPIPEHRVVQGRRPAPVGQHARPLVLLGAPPVRRGRPRRAPPPAGQHPAPGHPGRRCHGHRAVRLRRGAVPCTGRGVHRRPGGDRHRRAASAPPSRATGALRRLGGRPGHTGTGGDERPAQPSRQRDDRHPSRDVAERRPARPTCAADRRARPRSSGNAGRPTGGRSWRLRSSASRSPLPLRALFRYQGPPMEEGFMLVFPERVLRRRDPQPGLPPPLRPREPVGARRVVQGLRRQPRRPSASSACSSCSASCSACSPWPARGAARSPPPPG